MLSGIPTIFGINPHTCSSTQDHILGSIGVGTDGRKYRYVKAGATALVAGNAIQSPAEDTNEESLTPTAAAIGATSVTVTTGAAVTANTYADGYLVVTNTPGNGMAYRIDRHAATTGAASLTVYLKDPIKVALTTSSRVDLVKNPYNGVIQNPATPTGCPVGVAVYAITAAYYGWIGCHGAFSTLAGGNITVGRQVVANLGVAASVVVAANGTTEAYPALGYALTTVANGENAIIFWTLG